MLIKNILEKINQKFQKDTAKLNHILGVHRQAIKLARCHKVDIIAAQIAALLHDYTKNEPLEFHLSLLNTKIIKKYEKVPFIYHAFSASLIAEKEFNIKDKKILNAIKKHVWGHKRMNKLDKIIFLSDKTEYNINYPQINYFRKLAFENMNQSIYFILKSRIEFFNKQKNIPIFEENLEILDIFKKKRLKRKR
ncbi:bis(5'-nucleosyl)-tetraphosphatase (symmetrical) YqeK [Candidatus Phytoplasma pini]|uniref:bis(5'-nucleosyl)-tetraphosphatase (symmetrical) n=1 Tax=Candidatus Phytoplasma pini TaxID=267362 RepID=A0A559KJ99_9MOLU|nr:bis(5'-nucleosyl)-tetraphosphatase (symmetrical) YqeK [Candidatus Phytoplasma pini]TVY12200.1 hypothetical protein MDPP_00268 [Candidatus Phytoplasma pini]